MEKTGKSQSYTTFRESLLLPGIFVIILWLIKLLEAALSVNLQFMAIYPRHPEGLPGILTFPLVHGDWHHLFSNSVPLLVLGTAINYFYRPVSSKVFLWTYLLSGILLWTGGRTVYHIGASGLVYGFAAFLFFSGVFRKNPRLWALSLIIIFLYGGMIWGVLPLKNGISWEGHLFGAIAGSFCAFIFRNQGPQKPKYQWEIEEEEEERAPHMKLWDYRRYFPDPDKEDQDREFRG